MPVFSYRTIAHPAEGLYKESGSKFLAFAYPVHSESDIKGHLDALKKEYFDASHHCFAWILGAEKKQYRAFDDGEPNHSAGDPILGQLRSKDLSDVLIVVVRYFGGTKLGVGGLISAYKAAADDVLRQATILEKEITFPASIDYPYAASPDVMRLVKQLDLKIIDQHFAEHCSLKVEVKLSLREQFIQKTALLQWQGIETTM